MTKFINWMFSKTKLFKWLDGHKTQVGFLVWVLGWLINLLAAASGFFPDLPALMELHIVLLQLQEGLAELLKQVGLDILIVGVGHKAIKSLPREA